QAQDGRADRAGPQIPRPPQRQNTRSARTICPCNLTTQIVALPDGEREGTANAATKIGNGEAPTAERLFSQHSPAAPCAPSCGFPPAPYFDGYRIIETKRQTR